MPHVVLYARDSSGELPPDRMNAERLVDPRALRRGRTRPEAYPRLVVRSAGEAQAYARALIDAFNATTRPGEPHREIVRVEYTLD